MANRGTTKKLCSLVAVLALMVLMWAPLVPARAEEGLPALVVTATPSSVYVGEDATVTLSLSDKAGQPLKEGIKVIVNIDALGFASTGTTGAEGTVAVTLPAGKLMEGTFTGKVLVEGYEEGTFTLEVAGKKLNVEPASVSVVFAQQVTIEAVLSDAEEEKPVEKGTVAVLSFPKGTVTATVGEDGKVLFTASGPDHLGVGTFAAFISVEGYADAQLELKVEPGKLSVSPDSFEISFTKTATLVLKLAEEAATEEEEENEESTPLPEGTVLLVALNDYTDTVTVGKEGSATITVGADALKVGEEMELVLKVEGYEDLALPLKVNAGALKVDPAELTVKGTGDVVFTATLTDADGNDVPSSIGDEQLVATLTVETLSGTAPVGKNSKVTFTLPASAMEELGGGTFEGAVSLPNYEKATFKLTITDLPEKEKPQPPDEPTEPEEPVEPTAVVLEFTVGSNTFTVNDETVEMDVAPFVKDGRVMVPIRFLAETLGYTVDYDFSDPTNKTVTVHAVEDIVLTIGSNKALVGTEEVELDAVPELVNGRTMVPVRFVAETLGFEVQWVDGVVTLKQQQQP